MHDPLSILLISHGFPPHESAGTERHTEALATALQRRGHSVHVLAATRSPGRPQYEVIQTNGLTRIVNNIATRALSDGESDPIIDRIAASVETEFNPDIVHVHHTQFLSSTMHFNAPTVVTLHDQWAWCASGGLGLLPQGQPCEEPSNKDCAECHSQWRPSPSSSARLLTRAASAASPWVNPDTLHRLYQRIPARLRPSPVRGEQRLESAEAAAHRNGMMLNWFRSADARIAPSAHLAQLAETRGVGPVHVIRHGLEPDWFGTPQRLVSPSPFVHIGTIAHHKGTDVVVAAYRKLRQGPGLSLFGPILDPEAALGHPVGARLTSKEVREKLHGAQALVLGSRWAENAPLIIIEARAVGCPIIAPRIGGIPELIEEGVDGYLYEPGNDAELTEAMQRILDGPTLYPTHPPQFDTQVDRIERLYQNLHRQSA